MLKSALPPLDGVTPIFAGRIITQVLGEFQADDPTAEPADRSRGFLETGFLEDGIVRSLLEANGDLFVGDLDCPVRVDESTEDRLGSRVVETLQIVRETLVEHRSNHG